MDPETLKRKLFEHAAVMSTNGNGGLPILSCWDTEMVSHPEHGDHGVFFVNFFQSKSGEAGRGARLWLVSFFYADKSAS